MLCISGCLVVSDELHTEDIASVIINIIVNLISHENSNCVTSKCDI